MARRDLPFHSILRIHITQLKHHEGELKTADKGTGGGLVTRASDPESRLQKTKSLKSDPYGAIARVTFNTFDPRILKSVFCFSGGVVLKALPKLRGIIRRKKVVHPSIAARVEKFLTF